MKLCYIADANSIHTKRWLKPFIQQDHQIYLLSYKPVWREWDGLEELVDLTQLVNTDKMRFAYWGWWVNRYVRKIKPNVLHAHQIPGAGWLGTMANYHPFVVSGWGSDVLLESDKSAFRRFLTNRVLHKSDQVSVHSQLLFTASQRLGVPTEKLSLIPWDIETDIFRSNIADREQTRARLGLRNSDFVVLGVRGISPLYNTDILLEAVKTAVKTHPYLHLVLLRYNVHPAYIDSLTQKIADWGLQSSVHWLPLQESVADMAALYRMADVMTSIPSSEGYGFTVYEAMACGCPTIISNLPAFEGDLTDGFHTIKTPPRDITAVTQAINNLINDNNLRETLRQNGLQFSEERSTVGHYQQTMTLYNQLIAH